jgi:DnaK suppressor protein
MNPHARETVEALLTARAEELRSTRIAMMRSSDGQRHAELAHVDNHPADLGSELHDEELDETTKIYMDEEERRIAEALRALSNGTYGTCLGCHGEIPSERLEAVPEAVRCLDCQRRFEGMHRQQTRI